ncbi:MAG: zeta toxin family protein [Lactococcus lactis]|nr:zeta toxin family protein [Lactococcus lactis]
MTARISIITGAPGTGKSTVSEMVADFSPMDKSVHLHTDDFYHYLKKGAIPPHLSQSQNQNEVVMGAILKTAAHFAKNGYDVIVDGIVGPWFITPWKKLTWKEFKVNYFILRAEKKVTLKRAALREKLSDSKNIELVESMWEQFNNLNDYETNVIDTTYLTAEQTANLILESMLTTKFSL